MWGGGVPLPTGEGALPPPQKIFFEILGSKWRVFVDSRY